MQSLHLWTFWSTFPDSFPRDFITSCLWLSSGTTWHTSKFCLEGANNDSLFYMVGSANRFQTGGLQNLTGWCEESENRLIVIIVWLVWRGFVWPAVHQRTQAEPAGTWVPEKWRLILCSFLAQVHFLPSYVMFRVLLMGRCKNADDGFSYSWFGLQRKCLHLNQVPQIRVVFVT